MLLTANMASDDILNVGWYKTLKTQFSHDAIIYAGCLWQNYRKIGSEMYLTSYLILKFRF